MKRCDCHNIMDTGQSQCSCYGRMFIQIIIDDSTDWQSATRCMDLGAVLCVDQIFVVGQV